MTSVAQSYLMEQFITLTFTSCIQSNLLNQKSGSMSSSVGGAKTYDK